MNVFVVIVSYKVTDLTIDCLRSLAPEIGSVPDMRVAVVENGTDPDGVEADRLRKAVTDNHWGDWCEVHAIHPNLGFTGGNNAVIEPAMRSDDPPRYVLLLNSDTVVRPGAIKALYDFLEAHPKIGIAGSRLENPDGSGRQSLFRFYSAISEFCEVTHFSVVNRLLSRWRIPVPIPDKPAPVDWLAGASMLIRREVLDAIGALDAGYYTYFDDIDYCLNAARAGWPTWYIPDSRVIHLAGQSTGVTDAAQRAKRRPTYWFEARRRFWLKNHGKLGAALADAGLILGLATKKLALFVTRKPDHAPEKMLTDAIRHSVFRTGFAMRDVRNPARND